MKYYEKTIVVEQDDLDDLYHVNNVRYVQWIQDISKEHWQKKASKEILEEVVWVVMNHNITYKNAAKLNDTILVRTFIEKSRGAVSIRVVEMFDAKTNALLVRSSTEWCLLNAKTFKPTRISEDIKAIFANETL
ncbi:acyl-CoA thioesterase [Aurantibacter crassamenti]|uniref:acyl-CoA thioesterase n=1 Tax=Aurantibacter crassamenti TaxID=1837375 RepID=UPI00193AC284|nr:acyl-ACP thioesterase domain-containing protein [Aurantibacter crassamenti]MBM1107449.1 acyl-CoA thioesterase [Aurantibacter crassamenti]